MSPNFNNHKTGPKSPEKDAKPNFLGKEWWKDITNPSCRKVFAIRIFWFFSNHKSFKWKSVQENHYFERKKLNRGWRSLLLWNNAGVISKWEMKKYKVREKWFGIETKSYFFGFKSRIYGAIKRFESQIRIFWKKSDQIWNTNPKLLVSNSKGFEPRPVLSKSQLHNILKQCYVKHCGIH